MKRRTTLRWEWKDGFWFAHASEGLWAIEQHRGRFRITLDLKGVRAGGNTQVFGYARTSAAAKAEAQHAHRTLFMQELATRP